MEDKIKNKFTQFIEELQKEGCNILDVQDYFNKSVNDIINDMQKNDVVKKYQEKYLGKYIYIKSKKVLMLVDVILPYQYDYRYIIISGKVILFECNTYIETDDFHNLNYHEKYEIAHKTDNDDVIEIIDEPTEFLLNEYKGLRHFFKK